MAFGIEGATDFRCAAGSKDFKPRGSGSWPAMKKPVPVLPPRSILLARSRRIDGFCACKASVALCGTGSLDSGSFVASAGFDTCHLYSIALIRHRARGRAK